MTDYTQTTVGKVNLKVYPESTHAAYSDGEVENEMLKMFESTQSEGLRQAILSGRPSWPEMYHLSYGRETLLNWIAPKKKGSVLEFGGGCGALTGVLTSIFDKVTSVELSERRAKILANRHKNANNLNVVAQNIMNFTPKYKYDLVTAIGTIEYSPSYIKGGDPFKTITKKLRSFLKPDGCLIIAIENKLGLKYWTGATEDHTGRIFEGLYDYPDYSDKVTTFSKKELFDLLKSCGFKKQKYYYPYPDYKLPYIIYSDDFYPGHNNIKFPVSILPAPDTDQRRHLILSEPQIMRSLEKSGLFKEFSNSFLVFAYA